MERGALTYKGVEYPIIIISACLIDSEMKDADPSVKYTIADIELWYAIEEDYEDCVDEAIDIDNSIFYYCDSGFVASKPSEEEVINYLKHTIG